MAAAPFVGFHGVAISALGVWFANVSPKVELRSPFCVSSASDKSLQLKPQAQ